MARLILLGGPPGVGKSTVMRRLATLLPRAAFLDADDVWRISKELAPGNRAIAHANVIAVMRGYFAAGCDIGVVSWVFARPELYDPVIAGLRDLVDIVEQIYLVAPLEVISQRLGARGDAAKIEYANGRLRLITALPFTKIDTSAAAPAEAAELVAEHIHRMTPTGGQPDGW